jgi:hypothetical protein
LRPLSRPDNAADLIPDLNLRAALLHHSLEVLYAFTKIGEQLGLFALK